MMPIRKVASMVAILGCVVGCKSEARKQSEIAAIQGKASADQRALDNQKALEEKRLITRAAIEAMAKLKREKQEQGARDAALKTK
jgi:4-hydroxy-3-methylbut-2-en-1-yl diphosphate synthase IspG/GcpE